MPVTRALRIASIGRRGRTGSENYGLSQQARNVAAHRRVRQVMVQLPVL
jgi:hypothetical protein